MESDAGVQITTMTSKSQTISILASDVSHNCVGRAFLLGQVLQKHFTVEIIGPAFNGSVWPPISKQNHIRIKPVSSSTRAGKLLWQINKIREQIEGDVIYAAKPLLTSLGTGSVEKLISSKPLVLDIDDWEVGFRKEAFRRLSGGQKARQLVSALRNLLWTGSYWNALFCERLSNYADAITVSNSFLKSRFGGSLIPHGRDTAALNPARYNRSELRKKYKIPQGHFVVAFIGTPLRYKGVEDLVQAMAQLKECDVVLLLVGLGETPFSIHLTREIRARIPQEKTRLIGYQPLSQIAEPIAVSDLIVIPQRGNAATLGQTPAKVFDAMAMGKPIIGTDVADLPTILANCGWIVPPHDPNALAQSIVYVMDHPNEAAQAGLRARAKCIRHYSWQTMEEDLIAVFDHVIDSRAPNRGA